MRYVLVCAILLLLFIFFRVTADSNIAIWVNGEPLVGPMAYFASGWTMLLGSIALFCTAFILVFFLAGVGLLIFGVFLFFGFLVIAWLFPFLLPLLLPLLLVWLFCAHRARKQQRERHAVEQKNF